MLFPRTLVAGVVSLGLSFNAAAQDPRRPADQTQPPPAAAQEQATPQDKADQPPAAVGEETAKPTRGFVSALVHNLGDDVKHMPRWNSAYFLAGGGAVALAVHQRDFEINSGLQGPAADTFFRPGKIVGATPTILAASAAMYSLGRTRHMNRLQHLGLDEIEATLLTSGIVELTKVSVRRERPMNPDGTHQTGTFSFPSGHAAETFAAATVLQQHLGYKAGVPTYLIASYVAMSRLHDNRHFASDVAFGAATGIVVGRSVTWHGRNFYGEPIVVPGGVGIGVSTSPK